MRTEPVPSRRSSTSGPATGVIRLLRPKQWVKNVLVLSAPGAAGVLTDPGDLIRTLIALIAFCLAASGTYALNDAYDVESDRRHPTKRDRPVASGAVSVATARLLGGGLIFLALAVSTTTGRWQLPVVVLAYVALTTSYTLWLKHLAVIDIAAVAGGFVLRAVAGAAATGVEVSEWFLIVASFGSLFMVAGKRSAEIDAGGDIAGQRAVLADYPPQFLLYVRSLASGVAVLAYCLWAFEEAAVGGIPWFQLSIVPFVLAILRYALRLSAGDGGAPEDVVLGDRTLQVLAVVWAVAFALGVYAP